MFGLQTFFESMPREAKKRKYRALYICICAWLSHCGSFGVASVLQKFHVTSAWCSLFFSFIVETDVLEFLQPLILVLKSTTLGRGQRRSFDSEPVGSARFSPFRRLQRRKWARKSLAFSSWYFPHKYVVGDFPDFFLHFLKVWYFQCRSFVLLNRERGYIFKTEAI